MQISKLSMLNMACYPRPLVYQNYASTMIQWSLYTLLSLVIIVTLVLAGLTKLWNVPSSPYLLNSVQITEVESKVVDSIA